MLIGNAGKDPEISTVKGDKKVTKFGLAVNEYGKNEKGENVNNTTWFNIVAWDKNAENLAKYLKKGQKVFVEGKLVVREYEKDGVKGKSVEVVVSNFELLSSKGDSESPAATNSAPEAKKQNAPEPVPADVEPSADDLPF